MLVPGAMAATSAATVMMKPADAAPAVEHLVHDLAHRCVEAARRVEAQDQERRLGSVGLVDGLGDVGGGDGMDDTLELDHRDVGLNGRRLRERAHEGRRAQGDPHG